MPTKVYNVNGHNMVRPQQNCLWRNDLKTTNGHILDNNYDLSEPYISKDQPMNRALSLNTTCKDKKKVCFGQVSCDVKFGIKPQKTIKQSNLNKVKKFDFYTYATCFSNDKGECPSAFDCMNQIYGLVSQYNDAGELIEGLDVQKGHYRTDERKYKDGTN